MTRRLYPLLAVIVFLTAVILILVVPDRFREPDDWAYKYAVENFSHGRLTVDNVLHQQQVIEAAQQGGQLGQYVQIKSNAWAFEKSPGYVYFLTPFYIIGLPQLANLMLAAGLALVTYRLLKRLVNDRMAFIGVALVMFTPVGLAMMQREFMDGFASAAFLGMGGGIYIDYCLRSAIIKPRDAVISLFGAGVLLAASVAIRYTNATVIAVFAVHFIFTRIRILRRRQWRDVLRETLSFGAGVLIPFTLLFWYQETVFGSPFSHGYQYTKGNVNFAYDYLGVSKFWQIITTNIKNMFWPLITGFPLLVLAIPASIVRVIQELKDPLSERHNRITSRWWHNLPPNVFWLLIAWLLAVFGLYMMYEWTAMQGANRPFIILTRFYLPALLPLAVLAALMASKLPGKVLVVTTLILLIVGSLFFVQSSTSTLRGAGVFPPPNGQIQLPPSDLARLIEQTRLEVKVIPTSQINLPTRLDVLKRWISELKNQGILVGQSVPPAEINEIQGLISQGKIVEACRAVDAAYAKLEQLVMAK